MQTDSSLEPQSIVSSQAPATLRELRCPAPIEFDRSLASIFVGGGIGVGGTSVANWQQLFIHELLRGVDGVAINPRRESFPHDDPTLLRKQVEWEHFGLHHARAVGFWFPGNYGCPITAFEMGYWSMRSKPMFVGMAPDYPHREAMLGQLSVLRPRLVVASSLSEFADAVRAWFNNHGRIDLPGPRPAYSPRSTYLAGGIHNCPDWQLELRQKMETAVSIDIVDPRNRNLMRSSLSAQELHRLAVENHQQLLRCESFCVWFPKESAGSVPLVELGMLAAITERPLFVGVEAGYFRERDVEIQIGLARPEVQVAHSLDQLADQVFRYYSMR